MAYISVYKGFVFIEGQEPLAKPIGKVEYKKKFSFNSQLLTLDAVKDQLMEQAVALGANAIVDFTYGQKSSGWFKSSLFSSDDNIKWYGSGTAVMLPPDRLLEILKKLEESG